MSSSPRPVPPRSVVEEQAWALKDQAQAAWSSDPSQTRAAALALSRLVDAATATAAAMEAAAGTDTEPAEDACAVLLPLAAWADGLALLAEGELPAALRRLRDAVSGWQALQQPLQAARVQVAEVVALSIMGRFEEALACGRDAESVLSIQGDGLAAAKLAINLGSLDMQRDCYAAAALHYQRAGVLAARAGARQHSIMADIGQADALSHAGELAEARRIYDRAEMRATTHGFAAQAASAGRGRALLWLSEGRYREGLAGLVGARRVHEHCGIEHDRVEVEKYLADAYLSLRLLPEALVLYEKLLPRFRAQSGGATLPWLLTQMASAKALAGQSALAQTHLEEAVGHFEAQSHALGLAWVRLLTAETLRDRGDVTAAEQGVRALLASDGLPLATARRAQLLLAACDRRLGKPAQALLRLDELLGGLDATTLPLLRTRSLHERGLALRDLGRGAEGARAFEQAIAEFEDLCAALPGDDLQQAVLVDHIRPYIDRLHHALCHESADAVLQWLDRYRARILSGRLQHGPSTAPTEPGDGGDAGLRARLRWLQLQRQHRLQDGEVGLAPALQAEAENIEHRLLEDARRQRLLQAGLAPHAGLSWAADTALAPTLDMDRVRATFHGRRALVAYGVAGDELFAIVVATGRVQLVRRLAGWAGVDARLRQLRFQIDTLRCGSTRLQGHMPQLLMRVEQHLRQLHGCLIAPLQACLAPAHEWVVVPHGSLHALPFAALHDGCGWLSDRVQLRVAASTAVAAMAPRAVQTATLPGLVVGDSQSLSHVDTEVQAVARALGQAPCLLGAAAQVDEVAQQATKAAVLHLACHGEFRADNALFSALHLADGPWTALHIAERPLPARLVVMSACDTGLADRMPGDESVGLVRAFLLAGAHEVVASLWAVDDAATADFMSFFYAALAETGEAAAALQAARQQARALRPHPFHWAAFALHGTPALRGA